jgi:PAS domain S-box-containing protein
MSTSWRLHVTGLMLGCVVGAVLYYGTTTYFMQEAEARLFDLLLQNRALYQYIQQDVVTAKHDMKVEGVGDVTDSNFYSAEMASSAFMARHVTEYLNQERNRYGLPAIIYRIAAVNPRNPVNTANNSDRQLIDLFNTSRDQVSIRRIVTTDSGKYLQVALPFLETGEACSRCHGIPGSASQELVNTNVDVAGSRVESGEIRAIETIEAPLESDILEARILFLAMFAALASTYFLIFIVNGLRRKIRKHTAQLAASEQKYRTLVEDLPCFVCSFLPDGTITYVNKLQAGYFQMTPDQMIGRRMQDILRPDVWQEAESQFRPLTAESSIGTHELRVVLSNGFVSWQHWIFRAIFDAQGEVAVYQAYAEDVTKRKEAEEAIKESEARFSKVFHASPMGICISRIEDGRFIDVNEAFAQLLGYKRNEMVGRTSLELNMYADYHDRQRLISMLVKQHHVRNVEGTMRHRSGALQDLMTSAELIHLGGEPHMLASVMDISERKHAEEALHASEERNRALLDAIPDTMLLFDPEGRLVDFRGSQDGLGSPAEPLVGISVDESPTPQEVKDAMKQAITSVLATGQAQQFVRDMLTLYGRRFVEFRFVKCSDSTVLCLMRNVTARKEAEEALGKSEKVMRGIFDSAPVGIILVAPDRTMLNANTALCSLSGYTAEELIGQSARILYISEEEYVRTGRDLYRQMKECGVGVQEMCMRHKDGRPVFVILRLRSCDPNDPGAEVIATVFDVTERKLAEEALRKSEQSYRAIARNLPGIVYRVYLRESYRVEFFNDWVTQITGYTLEELCGSDICGMEPLIHPDDRQAVIDVAKAAIREQDSFTVSFRLIHRDGGVRYLMGRGTVVPGEDGTPLHVDGLIFDMTERVHADEALHLSEEKYRSYVDNAPDAVMVVDKQGRFIEVNPAAERMTGYKRQELLELSIGDLLSADTNAAVRSTFIDLDRGAEKRGEVVVRRKDRNQVWWSVDGVKLGNDRYLSFCVDVTETRRLRELEARAQRLETAGRIAGQVAHDFNNLLAPLTAYPDMIREDLPKNHPALAYLSSIEDSAHQIAEINQQLLTLGRRGHYNQEPMNLNEVVGHVLEQMEKPPVSLVINVSTSDELMPMMGGRSQIHRVLMNLVQNAREAMQDVGRLSIRTENFYIDELPTSFAQIPRGEYVKLTISDTGCGISPEILEKVLDPFFTTKQADRKRGSGLGLSVVDAVVNDHHGYIDLSSEVGKGTSVYLYFPITRETADVQPVEAVTGGDEHVLVVDDDQTQREVCLHILKRLGYHVEVVMSGEKALELLQVKSFDLLILDMIMPAGIDGTETFRRVLDINPRQRALMLSGFAESDRVIEAQHIGAGTFLRKPVTRTTLALAVRRELDRIVAIPTSV